LSRLAQRDETTFTLSREGKEAAISPGPEKGKHDRESRDLRKQKSSVTRGGWPCQKPRPGEVRGVTKPNAPQIRSEGLDEGKRGRERNVPNNLNWKTDTTSLKRGGRWQKFDPGTWGIGTSQERLRRTLSGNTLPSARRRVGAASSLIRDCFHRGIAVNV